MSLEGSRQKTFNRINVAHSHGLRKMANYTPLDNFVAWLRFRAALPYIQGRGRVCDIGCGHEGNFLRYGRARVKFGMGLDYQPFTTHRRDVPFVRADITKGLPLRSSEFDNVVMLAVLEHLAEPKPVLREAFRILAPGGSLVMTWPAAKLDPVLDMLQWLGLISKEMESAKHQERIPAHDLIAMLRGIGFGTFLHRRFEFGLNNLLVAWKSC